MQTTHADADGDTPTADETPETPTADDPSTVSTADDDYETGASVDVPESINSPRAKLVYLYLATHGAVAEDQLCEGLEMKRITLYSILQTLRGADLVSRDDKRYTLA
jgi:hypothetical protein